MKQEQVLVSSLFLSLGALHKLLLPGHFGRAFSFKTPRYDVGKIKSSSPITIPCCHDEDYFWT
jgi:hypothetical protein